MITGLQFGDYTIPQGRIIKVEGLDSPPYRASYSDIAGVRGSNYNRSLSDKRAITIEWLILESSMTEFLDERAEVFSEFNAEASDSTGTLLVEVNDTTTYAINCAVASIELGTRAAPATYTYARAQLIAYDPVIYTQNYTTFSNIDPPGGGGAEFPLIFPITFTTSESGQVTATNAGTLYTYPLVTLNGDLTNPLIANSTTGDYFQLNYTIPSGSQVVIDFKNRTVMLDGVTNLITSIVAGSTWWVIEPGDNIISLQTASTGDTGNMTLTYREAYHYV